jgi:hypothetical protein
MWQMAADIRTHHRYYFVVEHVLNSNETYFVYVGFNKIECLMLFMKLSQEHVAILLPTYAY